MINCSCCQPPKSYLHAKSVWRHERKYNPDYKTPRERLIDAYEESPKHCLRCSVKLTYDQMVTEPSRKFCSHSCSATFNQSNAKPHRTKPHRTKTRFCAVCGNHRGKSNQKYCSRECNEIDKHNLTVNRIQQGQVSERPTIKRALIKIRGYACEVCFNNEWLGQSIPIELDHINGDPSNNLPDNLRLICPNCHALTPTAKGRNKGSGRKSRGIARN